MTIQIRNRLRFCPIQPVSRTTSDSPSPNLNLVGVLDHCISPCNLPLSEAFLEKCPGTALDVPVPVAPSSPWKNDCLNPPAPPPPKGLYMLKRLFRAWGAPMMLWYHDFRASGLDSENLGRGLGRGTWCDVSSVRPKADGGGYVLVTGDGPKCSS